MIAALAASVLDPSGRGSPAIADFPGRTIVGGAAHTHVIAARLNALTVHEAMAQALARRSVGSVGSAGSAQLGTTPYTGLATSRCSLGPVRGADCDRSPSARRNGPVSDRIDQTVLIAWAGLSGLR